MSGNQLNIDLVVTNLSPYTPFDPSLNGLATGGKLAQINVACNTHVNLRVTTTESCSTKQSCKICDGLATQPLIDDCYFQECSCYGVTVNQQTLCSGTNKESARLTYSCTNIHKALILPSEALVTITVFDFDRGPNGEYDEVLYFPFLDYERTPLRPTSDSLLTPQVLVQRNVVVDNDGRFTATANGDTTDNPTDPFTLSNDQAAKGVQIFFKATQGYVDATFTVTSSLVGCTGRNLLFAGDSALCAPPPPPAPPPVPPSTPLGCRVLSPTADLTELCGFKAFREQPCQLVLVPRPRVAPGVVPSLAPA